MKKIEQFEAIGSSHGIGARAEAATSRAISVTPKKEATRGGSPWHPNLIPRKRP